VLFSNAYRALSPNARTLLIEICSTYNGENNGSLYLSVRDAAARMGLVDPAAASRAFDDLQDMGFIELTKDSSFRSGSSGTSRARCWRLTFEPGPGTRQATHDYQDREAKPKTAERKRMERGQKALKTYRKQRDRDRFPVMDSHTLDDFSAMSVPTQCRISVPP
jgi:hypothetical protein